MTGLLGIHLAPNMLTLSPLDGVVALISVTLMLVGLKRELKGLTIFLQISLLLVKMVKHFYDTHPEAKTKLDKNYLAILDRLYNKHLRVHDKKLLDSKESSALG